MSFTVNIKVVESSARLKKKFDNLAKRTIEIKMRKAKNSIEQAIRDELEFRIANHPIFAGLKGSLVNRGNDLQAAFGLEDTGVVDRFVDDLISNFQVQIVGKTSNKFPILKAGIINQNKLKQMMSEDYASYQSDPSGEIIHWVKWLIEGENDPVTGALIHINDLTGEDGGLIDSIFKLSRTKRALMIDDRGPDWDLSEHGIQGISFFVNIINNPEFIKNIRTRMREAILG